jgi:hypothetical protein
MIGRGCLEPKGELMCRSIKTLRPPYTEAVTDDAVRAAALQYVRKVSGFRAPAAHNAAAFDAAVDAVAQATRELLGDLQVRGPARPPRGKREPTDRRAQAAASSD